MSDIMLGYGRFAERNFVPEAEKADPFATCNCRWDGETQVAQCELHHAHVNVIHEWAERAKKAEAALAEAEKAEAVATDWERIARVQDAKLSAMCDEPGAIQRLREIMGEYQFRDACSRPPRRELSEEQLRDFYEWLAREMPPGTVICNTVWWAPRIAAAVLRAAGQTESRELSKRDERQHAHEARRWCSGDSAWSEWQPCTAAQAASYAKDETFQVRATRGAE